MPLVALTTLKLRSLLPPSAESLSWWPPTSIGFPAKTFLIVIDLEPLKAPFFFTLLTVCHLEPFLRASK